MSTSIANTQWGEIEYYTDDRFVGRSLSEYGWYSKGEIDIFEKILARPGSIAIEAGANIGSLTIPMARMAQYVLAFEPQPENFFLLVSNARRNGLDNVWARHTAVGSCRGLTTVPYLAELGPRGNYGGVEINQGTYPVAVETIDDVVRDLQVPHVELIKADVEGEEISVFTGAIQTINRFRPILYFENDREKNSEELLSLVQSLKYRMYWHITPLHAGADRNIWEHDLSSFNVLGVPDESAIRVIDQTPIELERGRGNGSEFAASVP